MTINSFTVFDINKNIKFQQNNIKNIVHQAGEEYMLNVLFRQGQRVSSQTGSGYWLGLDNRTTLSATDIMSSVSGEPLVTTSYRRQEVSTWDAPIISNSVYVVKSSPVTFSAASVGWGPVSNIFLTTNKLGGILISSAKLSQTISLASGQSIVMTISLSLVN
jgi:hypothetical protein